MVEKILKGLNYPCPNMNSLLLDSLSTLSHNQDISNVLPYNHAEIPHDLFEQCIKHIRQTICPSYQGAVEFSYNYKLAYENTLDIVIFTPTYEVVGIQVYYLTNSLNTYATTNIITSLKAKILDFLYFFKGQYSIEKELKFLALNRQHQVSIHLIFVFQTYESISQ